MASFVMGLNSEYRSVVDPAAADEALHRSETILDKCPACGSRRNRSPRVHWLLLSVLLLGSLAGAQDSGTAINGGETTVSPARMPPPVTGQQHGAPQRYHTNIFAASLAIHWGGMIFDAASTHHALRHCNEGNPLFGSRPSNGRVLAPMVGFTTAYTGLSLRDRKRHPTSKTGIIWNFVLGGAHIAASAANSRCW